MKIHLLSYTKDPLKSISSAILSLGIGKGVTNLDEIKREDAIVAFKDTCKAKLDSPLEFASFNFFWEDVPIFLLRELIRHRVGCSYAEQSLRFAIIDESAVDKFNPDFVKSVDTPEKKKEYFDTIRLILKQYKNLIDMGIEVQDARNVLGVWIPTHITTGFTYRALRDILAVRQSSQAHNAWKDAVKQIKDLVESVDPVLNEELKDACAIAGKCIWQSTMDRPCSACEARGLDPNHIHNFTKFDDGLDRCTCGVIRKR
jgi:thymidylate synthase (FAD)